MSIPKIPFVSFPALPSVPVPDENNVFIKYAKPYQFKLHDKVAIKNTAILKTNLTNTDTILDKDIRSIIDDYTRGDCEGVILGKGSADSCLGLTRWIVQPDPIYCLAHFQMTGDQWTCFTFTESELTLVNYPSSIKIHQ